MNLDVLDVSIFDGHSVLPANRISIRDGIITEIGTGTASEPAERTITATGKLLTPGSSTPTCTRPSADRSP